MCVRRRAAVRPGWLAARARRRKPVVVDARIGACSRVARHGRLDLRRALLGRRARDARRRRDPVGQRRSGASTPRRARRIGDASGSIAGSRRWRRGVVTGDGRRVVTSVEGGQVVHDARTLRAAANAGPSARTGGAEPRRPDAADRAQRRPVRFLDLVTGARPRGVRPPRRRASSQAPSAPDGRTAGPPARQPDARLGRRPRRRSARPSQATPARSPGLAFTRDGRTLYSGGLDGKIMIWDLAGERRLGRRSRRARAATQSRTRLTR